MANTALNRSGVLLMTNKSGGAVAQGDVVVIDATTAASFTTTTTGAYASGPVGVVIEPNGIANNGVGLVAITGYVPKVALSGAASLGDLFKTHTVAKQAVRHAAPEVTGDFGAVLGTGTTPAAVLWGNPIQAASGSGYTQGARVYDSDGQTINNNSLTAIGFDSERYDTDTCHDAGSNTKLTATTAGKYIIIGNVQWAANTTGRRELAIRMDGTTYIGTDTRDPAVNVSYYQQVSTIWDMAATHYVELMVYHNIDGGGTLNIELASSYSPEFMMQRIG